MEVYGGGPPLAKSAALSNSMVEWLCVLFLQRVKYLSTEYGLHIWRTSAQFNILFDVLDNSSGRPVNA